MRWPRLLVGVLILGIAVAGAVAALQSSNPVQEPGAGEHCFAEWCVTPLSTNTDLESVTVRLLVRSDAKQASQKPDHPQAWLIDAAGRQVGGPQAALDDQLGPGETYVATLVFQTSQPGVCPILMVGEGAWPSFLGLGYAPSPFTTRVEWQTCAILQSTPQSTNP